MNQTTRKIDPDKLAAEVIRLKKEKNALLLAHYYQEEDIQDVADFVGDSLELARAAQKSTSKIIVFAGVSFMAEVAKILNPLSKVLLPDLRAGCSLSDSCPPALFERFKNRHPDHFVVTYINCSAEIKALSDIICTSSNAVRIVEQIPKDRKIIFAPDRNLGAYVAKKTDREMLFWPGSCIVHETFSLRKIVDLKVRHPDAEIIAHPECEEEILSKADFVGSTSQLIKHVTESTKEEGVLHQMRKKTTEKIFIPAPPNTTCSCNECPFMKLITLEKIHASLQNETPEVDLSEELRKNALIPLQRMLEWS